MQAACRHLGRRSDNIGRASIRCPASSNGKREIGVVNRARMLRAASHERCIGEEHHSGDQCAVGMSEHLQRAVPVDIE